MRHIIFSADQHIGASHMTTPADQFAALGALIEAANGADALILGGDATHHDHPTPETLAMWGRALAACRVPVIALAGNHDGPAVMRVFAEFRGQVHVVADKPEILSLYDDLDVAVLPWIPDKYVRAVETWADPVAIAHRITVIATDMLRGLLAQRRHDVPMILATHATIAGSTTSSGFNMGYRPSTYYVLPVEEVAEFDMVLAGHIHRHQSIEVIPLTPGGARRSIVYSGSLLPLDFSETESKGYVDAHVAAGGGGPAIVAWHHVAIDTPRVVTLDIDEDNMAIAHDVRGAIVRVRVAVSEAIAREATPARIRAAVMAAGARMAQVDMTITHPDRARDAGMTADLSPLAAIGRYLAATYIDGHDDTGAGDAMAARAADVVAEIGAARPIDDVDLNIIGINVADFLGVADAAIDLSTPGVYALTGPVGAGKSTIGADAVRFALFGTSRAGARVSDRLIRHGASAASVTVRLVDRDGVHYRVVRAVRAAAGGRTSSTLDVQRMNERGVWQPVAGTAKIRDNGVAIAALLGGLDDETLTASSIVVQRAADMFTRGDPADRKTMLARAAGLGVYDELADRTRDRANTATAATNAAAARVAALATRVTALPDVERDHAAAVLERTTAAARVADAEADVAAAVGIPPSPALAVARERVATLERETADAAAAMLRRGEVLRTVERMQTELRVMGIQRANRATNADRQLDDAKRARAELDRAACCAGEPSCVLLDATRARANIATDPTLIAAIADTAEPSDAENTLAKRIAAVVVPPANDHAMTSSALSVARSTVREYEAAAARMVDDARRVADGLRATMNAAAERAATLDGRLTELRAARAELETATTDHMAAIADAAAWVRLVAAWVSCRISVLETSVIPSVESIANDILRRFPYGIAIALRTQRDTRRGTVTETLDIDVLGGHGPTYEMCSGGQRTTIDVAFHIAIAIVVSRRAAARIRYLFVDEPEGLDEPGRMAFAAIMRWVHETYGMTVVVASHAADLVGALGGTRIDIVPGPDGSRAVLA